MASKWRVFALLMWKNLIVRKRHWKAGLFVQICLPFALFALTQLTRDLSATAPKRVENITHYNVITEEEAQETIDMTANLVYYLPKNEFVDDLMYETGVCLGLPSDNIVGFTTENELLKEVAIKTIEDISRKILAVVFKDQNEFNSTSKNLQYTIKSPLIPRFMYATPIDMISGYNAYVETFPFVQVQMCLDGIFLKMKVPNSSYNAEISLQQMPDPPHIELDSNDEMIRTMYAMTAVMAFLIPLCIEATYAANEKFIGVNILMSMNGVKNYQNLISWLVSGVIFSILYIIPLLLLFTNAFVSDVEPYLNYGNVFIVAVLLIVQVTHLLAYGMHIASYFSKSLFMISGILAIYVGSAMLQRFIVKSSVFTLIPYLGILFPNYLLFRVFQEISVYEKRLTGVRWSNLFVVGDDDYPAIGSLGGMFLLSIVGILLHFFLTLYVYAVLPGKYGVPKHPFFFLMRSKINKVSSEEEMYDCDYSNLEGKPFEPVPRDAFRPGIQIRNLKKSYYTNCFNRATHQALRGISIDFYKGQITALLGHNGAGKTTMMSILTGLLSPTEGMVLINGKKASDEMDDIISDLGLCPQEDMLFPDLNVFEQIEFFGLLKNKNKTKGEVQAEVNLLLTKLKLLPKKNVVPSKLSGGQKRRVCLGMAIIGDASTLILDEPTSGMDPESRRDTWDILLKMRGQKTILISTHNMEEADILGDRTAIIHLGRLKSYGSPMFLKKLYGQGNIEVTLSTEKEYNFEKIKSQFSRNCKLINLDGGKMVFNVPYTPELPQDLDKIEEKKEELGVNGISVSLITLEQVFLKATKEDEDEVDSCRPHMDEISKVTGRDLLLQSAMALFMKKLTYTYKNILTFWLIIAIPLVSIFLIGLDFNALRDTSPLIPIRLDKYRYPESFVSSDEPFESTYKKVVEEFEGVAVDVGGTNISQKMLDLATKDLATYRNNLIAAASIQINDEKKVKMNAFYSTSASYSIPISVNLLSNTLLKTLAGEDYEINVWSQKFPNLYKSSEIVETQDDTFGRVLLLIAFLYPTIALFVIHPLRETSLGVKQLQRMTGVPSWLYWGTMFLFDFLIFFVAIIVILLGFFAIDCIFDIRMFRGTEMAIMVLLLVLFALNTLPVVYTFSFLKKSTSTVITMLSLLPLGAIAMELILHILMLNISDMKFMELLRATQKKIFLMIPYISFFHGQISFFETAGQNAQCRRSPQQFLDIACMVHSKCCGLECHNGSCKKSLSYFPDFKGDINLAESVLYMSLTPIFYFTILGLLEHRIIPYILMKIQRYEPKCVIDEMDDQVKKEKLSVAFELSKLKTESDPAKMQGSMEKMNSSTENPENDSDAIYLVYELSKFYGLLPAVKEINFSVKKSECFGLLGVNGAGKSTTFRMLTGDEFPNSGVMYLGGKEIYNNRKEYLAQMGYCPQTSALINSLNARDHLRLFAMIRGVPKEQVHLEVEKWINRLNLNLCAAQPSGAYSGGNKRRLNIAIALIGNPNLVLLDEPTTGVDPAARRSLWHVIKSCQLAGQSIILTSHSMEECEALCNRLVIMVKGQFVCIGQSQQLKQRFGAGYDINLKLNPERSNSDVEKIKNDLESTLECELRDEHVGYITYHVTNSKTTWKTMYHFMEVLKETYECIEDFTVLSATLEQLFLHFARG